MGFAPLPFDPRSSCFCHQNCPSFKKPTSRWWLVWTLPPPTIPILGVGVLVEFDFVIFQNRFCQFVAVTLPVGVSFLSFSTVPRPPVPGATIRRQCTVLSNVGDSVARLDIDNEECDIPLNIPRLPPNDPFGDCNIFPVRWYEDANAVPH